MKTQLRKLWSRVSSSFWFVPALLVLFYSTLALALLHWDRSADREELLELPGLFHGGADSARAVLSVIAQSTITVMGVVFSVTIVALTLASTQYTPRVLYTFTRDRGNQIVMGILIGTFTYALLVLRAVRSTDEGRFVPPIAVTGVLVLALVVVGALLYFIHHISTGIRAATVISNITTTTRQLLSPRFPATAGAAAQSPDRDEPMAMSAIPSAESGYIQIIDGGAMIACAARHDLLLRLERGPGDFVVHGGDLLHAGPASRVTSAVAAALRSSFAFGHERSMQQDPEFGIRQLMDIAVKALSPSVNDPTTAVAALDHISSLLVHVAPEEDPAPWRADDEGVPRLVARGPTFASMLAHALDQIRQHASGDVAVTMRLIVVLTEVGRRVTTQERRELLWRQAGMIAADADRNIRAAGDRETLNEVLTELAGVLIRDAEPLLIPIHWSHA